MSRSTGRRALTLGLVLLVVGAWVAFLTPGALEAQPEPDQASGENAAVRAALEHYLAGHATGQGEHFDSAFHDVADLHWVADGELRTRTGEAYIAGAPGEPAEDEAERHRRIAWIDVRGSAAAARIDLDYPAVRTTDFMLLLKVGGEWRIVNKIFHAGEPHDRLEGAGAGTRPVDARGRITEASRAFSRAYLAGDTAAIRDLYTPDALLLPPGGRVRGREAIGRYFAPSPDREDVSHRMRSEELTVSGDQAVDVGTWTNATRAGDGSVREASGSYLVVWRRGDDGRWRMAYDAWHRPVER